MIYIILAEGFEEIEALTPLDVLRRGKADVKCAAITGDGLTVKGSHGISVVADMRAEDIGDDIDMLVFPGGLPGATNIDESPLTDALIEKAKKKHAHLAAICAAPMILGKRGLLNGKKAVCYPGFEEHLHGAKVVKKRVVTDKNITTAIGMGASLEFAERLLSEVKDKKTAKTIVGATFPK